MRTYPSEIAIAPLAHGPRLTLLVPGSKSITNRALILAALGSGACKLQGALQSEDTEVMIECLSKLGWHVHADWTTASIDVSKPVNERIVPAHTAGLFVGNSGTSVRFLAALVTLGSGEYRLDGVERMRERPIQDLLDALQQLGVDATSERGTGCPPVLIRARGLRGGRVQIKADKSSQFLSAVLLACPFAEAETDIEIIGELVSEPYLDMTCKMLNDFGLALDRIEKNLFHVPGSQICDRDTYHIEPDASSASYFFAAAAITQGTITVRGMNLNMLQGDVQFVLALEKMGCQVSSSAYGLTVTGGPLHGIDIDMNAISDTVMSLAVVACFASSPTTIRNVAHIRHKETDRIHALATELRRLGATIDEFPDGLRIHPAALSGCSLPTYNDHRMAMCLALIGLKVPGVIIQNPGCVAKTYPGYWDDFSKLYRIDSLSETA